MRVVAGSKRGAVLLSPKGDETRPTTDRVKENIFNLIQFDVSEKEVLDLFSGSGAMGIEALSRGALFCTFVDSSKSAIDIIKKNVAKTGFQGQSETVNSSFDVFLNNTSKKFSLVFLDPPYHKGYIDKATEILIKKNLLKDDAVIVCETDYDEELLKNNTLSLIKEKHYGRVRVRIFRLPAN